MKCFTLMFLVFFLLKIYAVFSVRQEIQKFNLSMMESPNMNSMLKAFQQTQSQTSSPFSPVITGMSNSYFDQMIKFYQFMNAFNQNNNNNLPSFPNNQNFMYLPQLNNQLNPPQAPQKQIDTNLLLKNLISQLQIKPNSKGTTNEDKIIFPKKNLRKKKEFNTNLIETHKTESNLISDKLKEDIKKLQELTKEANKIMIKKVIKKDDTNEEYSPDYLLQQRSENGPIYIHRNSEANENIKNLQESIKVIPERQDTKMNLKNNEISMPSMKSISDSFENVSELKNRIKSDEEEKRKEEFEDKLNYLLSKLDVISKINDK